MVLAVSSAAALMSVPTPVAVRQFGQQRQQDRTGAGAEVGDAERTIRTAVGAQHVERGFDHGFSVGPRHQRVRRQLQR